MGGLTGAAVAGTQWIPNTTATVFPDPYQQMQTQLVQYAQKVKELEEATRGLTQDKFNAVKDADLILELIARGYQVSKMDEKED